MRRRYFCLSLPLPYGERWMRVVPLALRGFRLVAHSAVAHAIEEIDSKPDDQPDTQPEPCVAGQTHHEQNGGQRSRRRHEIDSGRLEGPLDVWLRHAQSEHAAKDASKRKQRA